MSKQRLELQMASEIPMKQAKWLWDMRIPLGSLTLLAGAEGIGKSSLTYKLIAEITTGTLEGAYYGVPKSVFIVATEDSWEHTIVPRLMAAGADLTRVANVEADNWNGTMEPLTFPADVHELGKEAAKNDVALIVLDPIMSRIGGSLDTHKDQEVRQALEPLVRMAGESGVSVLGIIHINKRNSNDALNNMMGSRAFSAVSRAVIYVQEDPEDTETKYVNQAKSNLGPKNMADLKFQIKSKKTGDWENEEGDLEPIYGSYLVWTGEKMYGAQQAMTYKPERIIGRPVEDSETRDYKLEERKSNILAYAHANRAEAKSMNQISAGVGGNRQQNFAAIKELLEEGSLLLTDQKKVICKE